jgi:hypothetical protein
MDVFHDFAFPLTIASLVGAAGVIRYWVGQVNDQINKMNEAHLKTLELIAVIRTEAAGHSMVDDIRFKDLHRRVSILEKAGLPDNGYA